MARKKQSMNYKKFLDKRRLRPSSIVRSRFVEEFYSDRSRIVYSSSFRRLQQKAQVFSLETNASVRTRLTHSIEVSDLGRTLANRIAYRLTREGCLTINDIPQVVSVVENACLLHDIGNPPFGHFGEAAIKDWASGSMEGLVPDDIKDNTSQLKNLIKDFQEFDGNPQGFRIVTKLQSNIDEFGLNLTYATLLCILKYARTTGETSDKGIRKKAGYFQTEQDIVKKIYKDVGIKLHRRSPFVYIMEAADDIAYCMSDIADGIEKGIITEKQFLDEFKNEWENKYNNERFPVVIPEYSCLKDFNHDISIPWSKLAMDEAVEVFFKDEQKVYSGSAKCLLRDDMPMGRVLEIIKKVSRRVLYTSFEAENIEITGYAVITGILERYSKLLTMSESDFCVMVSDRNNLKGYDYEKRLFNHIGKRYVMAYSAALEKADKKSSDYKVNEWWLRAHMIVDHVSGMTDEYALETYQMLEGISIMR